MSPRTRLQILYQKIFFENILWLQGSDLPECDTLLVFHAPSRNSTEAAHGYSALERHPSSAQTGQAIHSDCVVDPAQVKASAAVLGADCLC